MRTLALVLAFTPLVTQANTMNPYVRDHEAYASWHPLLTQVGGTIAAILLGANFFKTSRQVARLCQPANDRFRQIQEEDARRNAARAAQNNQQPAANGPACPICAEQRPLMVLHQSARGDEHRACEECVYNQYKASQVWGDSPYRPRFCCGFCRADFSQRIQDRMAAIFAMRPEDHGI